MNKIFIGYTRFSLVSESSKAWVISQKEDYLQKLFDSERLNDRLFFLEQSLESLSISNTIHQKYHFVFYSDVLPKNIKEKLLSLCEKYTFVIPVEIPSNSVFNFLTIISLWLIKNDIQNALIGLYGLDDDDFLSTDYFLYSEQYLSEKFIGFHISYGLGIKSYFYKNTFSGSVENYLPKINIGILTICKFENSKINWPGGGSHPTLDKRVPVILDSRKYMYLWTRHSNQDTNSVRLNQYSNKYLEFSDFDEEIVREKFPKIYSFHGKNKLISVAETKNKETFHIKNPGKCKLRVCYEKCNILSQSRPLLSFNFSKVDHLIISKLNLSDLGLAQSRNEAYGFYKYLSLDVSKSYVDIIVDIPIEISDFSIKVFKRSNSFEITSIDIYQVVI